MKYLKILLLGLVSIFAAQSISAHCQVPCGIYGDELKFGELEQHVATIAKASAQITELAAKKTLTAQDQQQLIRWTTNKESHAAKIIDETANYFLAQRIKPGAEHYADKVELLHHIIVYSMKSKQTTGGEAAKVLGEKIAAFKEIYLHHHH
ncbi:MAG: superoxide dismutase [Ni] [Opitutaceae bacterium]